MSPGDTETLGEYRFTFVGTEHASFPDREEDYARFEVYQGDRYLGIMEPFRAEYPSFRIASTIGAIHSTPIEDFYIVPSEFRGDGEAIFPGSDKSDGVVDVGVGADHGAGDAAGAVAEAEPGYGAGADAGGGGGGVGLGEGGGRFQADKFGNALSEEGFVGYSIPHIEYLDGDLV